MKFLIFLLTYTLLNWENINQNNSVPGSNNETIIKSNKSYNRLISKDFPVFNANPFPTFTSGLEIRQRFRYYNNLSFGDVPPGENDYDFYWNNRIMVHGDLHFSKHFRLFAKLNHCYTLGKDNISSKDNDLLGVSQAFIEFNTDDDKIILKFGRQELSFGSGRIIGSSEGPNVSQNFDGLKSTITLGKITADFLFVSPTEFSKGVLDNDISTSNLIYGMYWNFPLKQNLQMDLYTLGNDCGNLNLANNIVHEARYSVGTCFRNETGPFFYDFEATWQLGKSGDKNISAYNLTYIAGYQWLSHPMVPITQVKLSVFSGNKEGGDQQTMFRPIYSRPPISSMAPIGPANIILFNPDIGFNIIQNLEFRSRFFFVWRLSASDGVYSRGLDEMLWGSRLDEYDKGRNITDGLIIQSEYTFNQHFNLSLSAGYFKAGYYLRNTGNGKDVQAVFLVLNYTL